MVKLKINGLMNDEEIRWKKIKCCCSKVEGDVEHQHPIGKCIHCKCQAQEDSMPREQFQVCDDIMHEDNVTVIKKQTKTVKEINIVRGEKYQDILGWSF